MAELERRIADLEEEIKGYVSMLNVATSAQEKSELLHTINTARETLNRLLDEKSGGN